jgi:hypothetical protein
VEIFIRSSREAIVVVDERTETCGCAVLGVQQQQIRFPIDIYSNFRIHQKAELFVDLVV